MRRLHKLKKTETLELRLPYETKQAFMAQCRTAGVSASEALRGFIAETVEGRRPGRAARAQRIGPRARIGLVVGALLAASALAQPSLAHANASAGFARLDMDHDGRVSFAEFSRQADPKLSLDVGAAFSLAASARLSPELRLRILREQFDRIDADRNGQVSWTEFRRVYDR